MGWACSPGSNWRLNFFVISHPVINVWASAAAPAAPDGPIDLNAMVESLNAKPVDDGSAPVTRLIGQKVKKNINDIRQRRTAGSVIREKGLLQRSLVESVADPTLKYVERRRFVH